MPRLEYDVVFNLDQGSTQTLEQSLNNIGSGGSAKNVQRTKDEVSELNVQLDRTSASADEARQALRGISSGSTGLKRMQNNVRGAANETQNLSKVANNSNQILFSFGDAVQDGAQFSQGFASGARAVGNNLTFAAEQIALASRQAGGFGSALKGIGSAMLGPAGIVFAVNAAVTAVTLFSQSAERAEKEANKMNVELKQSRDFLKEIAQQRVGDFADRFSETETTISAITRAINSINNEMDRLTRMQTGYQDVLRNNNQLSDEQRKILGEQLTSVSGKLNKDSDINKLAIDILKNKRAELVAQQRIDQVLSSVLSKEQGITDTIQGRFDIRSRFEQRRAQARLSGDVDTFSAGTLGRTPEELGQRLETQNQIRIQKEKETFARLGLTREQGVNMLKNQRINAVKEEVSATDVALNGMLDKYKATEKAKTEITRQQAAARRSLISQAASAAGNILTAAFGQSKEVRIAQTLIDTYASAQSAYASQLIPGDPSSLARAQAAAGLAVASGLARVAQIVQTDIGDSGGGGGGASRSQGISTTDINSTSRPQPNGNVAQDTSPSTNIVIEANNILPDTEFSKRAENGRKQRETDAIVVNRNR